MRNGAAMPSGQRILVCGGRWYGRVRPRGHEVTITQMLHEQDTIDTILAPLFFHGDTLVHGAAPGADTLAAEWARSNSIDDEAHPADWNRYGKRAGYIRNAEMLAAPGGIDFVVAFPGGNGTKMMAELARKAGVQVIEVEPWHP